MTQTNGPSGAAMAVLIPEFPQQTHIAWWRVANAMRGHGQRVHLMSTRRARNVEGVHHVLQAELPRTLFAWPPAIRMTAGEMLRNPAAILRAVRYLAGLPQSTAVQKARLLPLVPAAAHLVALCRRHNIDRVFVHSCANAAHLLAIAHAMSGLRYALRLGGDPQVYGKDHSHKMAGASFIACGAPVYFEELIRDHDVPASKLVWTWVGVDLTSCSPSEDWPAQSEPGRLRLVSVARLNPTKGHADVLAAIKRLKEEGVLVRYTIIGEGPHRATIEAQVTQLGLEDEVTLTGALDHGNVVAELRRSDVHVLASFGLGESSPAVVSEAMACGLPTVCTVIGATQEMVRDGEDGYLVPQRDVDALADRLGRLARDPELLRAMKSAALPASEKFDVRGVARKIIDWFDRFA